MLTQQQTMILEALVNCIIPADDFPMDGMQVSENTYFVNFKAIQTALDVAKHFNGKVNLGIRPCDEHSEIQAWCPNVDLTDGAYQSPLWLILIDGQLMIQAEGIRPKPHLIETIRVFISDD